jgi:MerR HTH family regulatory protein
MTVPRRRASRLRVTHHVLAPGAELVELAVLARDAGVPRSVAGRFVALGLLEPVRSRAGRPLFPRTAAARLASAARLRRDLGLNYAGAVLACELLVRIEELEQRLESAAAGTGGLGPEVIAPPSLPDDEP